MNVILASSLNSPGCSQLPAWDHAGSTRWMDRCLIQPARKFTCHRHSHLLYNSSSFHSKRASNITGTLCPRPLHSAVCVCRTVFHLFSVGEQAGKRVQGLNKDSAPRGPPHRDNDDSPPTPTPPTTHRLPVLHSDTEQRGLQ